MKYISVIIAILLLAASCDGTVEEPVTPGRTPVDIVVSVDGHASRAATRTYEFAENQTYGIAIYENGHGNGLVSTSGTPDTFNTPHNSGTGNICATQKSGWVYNYEGSSIGVDKVYIMEQQRSDGEASKTADFYAYAPWLSGVTDIREILFSIDGVSDLMWASQNETENTGNKAKDPATSGQKVSFTFKHALSRLHFKFKLRNDIAPVTLHEISISAISDPSDPSNPLVPLRRNLTFNALNGNVEYRSPTRPKDPADGELVVTYDPRKPEQVVRPGGTGFPVLIYPEAVNADQVYHVEFKFDYAKTYEFDIVKDMITHSDNTTVGFQKGYEYIFEFTIDNYLHLTGVTINDEWTPATWESSGSGQIEI